MGENVSTQVLFKKYICLCTKDRPRQVTPLASRKVSPYNKIEPTCDYMVVPVCDGEQSSFLSSGPSAVYVHWHGFLEEAESKRNDINS